MISTLNTEMHSTDLGALILSGFSSHHSLEQHRPEPEISAEADQIRKKTCF